MSEKKHGFLLWADEEEGKAVAKKLHEVEPFKRSYRALQGSWEQGAGEKLHNVRGIWRQGADTMGRALNNVLLVATAMLSGARLMRMARIKAWMAIRRFRSRRRVLQSPAPPS